MPIPRQKSLWRLLRRNNPSFSTIQHAIVLQLMSFKSLLHPVNPLMPILMILSRLVLSARQPTFYPWHLSSRQFTMPNSKKHLNKKWGKIRRIWITPCVKFWMTSTSLVHFYAILCLSAVHEHTPKTKSNVPATFLSTAGALWPVLGALGEVSGVDGVHFGTFVGGEGVDILMCLGVWLVVRSD